MYVYLFFFNVMSKRVKIYPELVVQQNLRILRAFLFDGISSTLKR